MAATRRPHRPRRPRRPHAASASRILVGGVSVAATFGLTAHWGIQTRAAETVQIDPVAATQAEPQQRLVIVRRIIREVYAEPNGPAPDATAGAPVPAASVTEVGPAPAPAAEPTPAPAAVPALPSAALAPPPAPAPAPATSSNGS